MDAVFWAGWTGCRCYLSGVSFRPDWETILHSSIGGDHPRPSGDASSLSPDGSPARRAASLCICPSVDPGKTSSVAPLLDCEPCHFQPDGTAGVNADGDLTHSPDYPTASQTCARLVPERLLLHATLTISPAMATAGRHHRSCVATSRRPHPNLLGSGLAHSPSLTHRPWCQRQRPSLRWIRAYTSGGNGAIVLSASATSGPPQGP